MRLALEHGVDLEVRDSERQRGIDIVFEQSLTGIVAGGVFAARYGCTRVFDIHKRGREFRLAIAIIGIGKSQ